MLSSVCSTSVLELFVGEFDVLLQCFVSGFKDSWTQWGVGSGELLCSQSFPGSAGSETEHELQKYVCTQMIDTANSRQISRNRRNGRWEVLRNTTLKRRNEKNGPVLFLIAGLLHFECVSGPSECTLCAFSGCWSANLWSVHYLALRSLILFGHSSLEFASISQMCMLAEKIDINSLTWR